MTPAQEFAWLSLVLVTLGIVIGALGVIVWATRPYPGERAAHERKHRNDQAEITRVTTERDRRGGTS